MDEILQKYEIRKSNKEKTEFIEYMKNRLEKSGYDKEADIQIEEKGKGIFKSRNIVVGDPGKAKILLSAHYDTCAMLPFPNLMSPTNVGLFVGYQLLITVFLMVLSLLPAFVASFWIEDGFIIYYIWLLSLWLFLLQLMFGYRNNHTANDNTSGVIAITHILESLPEEAREKVCVIYFDNEEKGLFGSDFFYTYHKKQVKDKLIFNIDCVGDGEYVTFLSKKKAREDKDYDLLMEILEEKVASHDVTFLNRKVKPMMFASDQMHFVKGVGVCSLKKSPIGMYVARIHTPFDTKCREENINYLVDGIGEYIGRL